MNTSSGFASVQQPVVGGPLLIAHRGLSARFPENTLASFAAAQLEGSEAVEFDVQLTADGEIVVFHDEYLSRITGQGGRVSDFTYDELCRLDAGAWKGETFVGQLIPRLADLEVFWSTVRFVNIEMKSFGDNDYRLAEAVAAYVHERKGNFLVSASDWELLRYYRRLDPVTPLAVLFDQAKWTEALALADELGAVAVNPDSRSVAAPWVALARGRGLDVYVHTINSPEDAASLYRLGVTGIFTDDTTVLQAALADVLASEPAVPQSAPSLGLANSLLPSGLGDIVTG